MDEKDIPRAEPDKEDDLPEWLKEMVNPTQPVTLPEQDLSDSSHGWRKEAEVSQDGGDDELPVYSSVQDKDHPAEAANEADPLPDWVNVLSSNAADDESSPNAMDNDNRDDPNGDEETTDKINVVNHDDDDEKTAPFEIKQPDHSQQTDFIEISDLDINLQIHPSSNHPTGKQEDELPLPEWLHEMIADEDPLAALDLDAGVDQAEITEWPDLSDEELDSISPEDTLSELSAADSDLPDFIPPDSADRLISNEQNQRPEHSETVAATSDLEDTAPVIIKPVSITEDQISEAASTAVVHPLDGGLPSPFQIEGDALEPPPSQLFSLPERLQSARASLEQGNHAEALAVFKAYIERSIYLNEIKTWLLSALQTDTGSPAEIWETLGDLYFQEEDYPASRTAYQKAIQALLLQGNSNETG